MEDIKVLIVNNDREERDFLTTTLKNEGFFVFSTSDGRTAVTRAKELLPNLIILDVVMQGMDGIETCKELKSLPECAGTSIMFLSSRAEDYTQIAALDAGADEYILKPIRPRVLISRINAIMRRTLQPSKNVVTFGKDLTIDRHSHSVKIGKTEISLSKKEFDLLKLLTSKPGKVYSRQSIHEIVWNGNIDINDRIIDVHVWKLRQKLGRGRIKTLKGIGYKMEI
jgi:two-component system alkaline phosphatase synthesis response regulator PhoP